MDSFILYMHSISSLKHWIIETESECIMYGSRYPFSSALYMSVQLIVMSWPFNLLGTIALLT